MSMAIGLRTLEVDGVALELKVVRKRVKNINARLHGKTLSVSAPHRVSVRELDETIVELARKGPLDRAVVRLAALAHERMTAARSGHPSKPDDLSILLYRRSE